MSIEFKYLETHFILEPCRNFDNTQSIISAISDCNVRELPIIIRKLNNASCELINTVKNKFTTLIIRNCKDDYELNRLFLQDNITDPNIDSNTDTNIDSNTQSNIYRFINRLPADVYHLILDLSFNDNPDIIKIDNLPMELKILTFNCNNPDGCNYLPYGLKQLNMGIDCNNINLCNLPATLEEIQIYIKHYSLKYLDLTGLSNLPVLKTLNIILTPYNNLFTEYIFTRNIGISYSFVLNSIKCDYLFNLKILKIETLSLYNHSQLDNDIYELIYKCCNIEELWLNSLSYSDFNFRCIPKSCCKLYIYGKSIYPLTISNIKEHIRKKINHNIQIEDIPEDSFLNLPNYKHCNSNTNIEDDNWNMYY